MSKPFVWFSIALAFLVAYFSGLQSVSIACLALLLPAPIFNSTRCVKRAALPLVAGCLTTLALARVIPAVGPQGWGTVALLCLANLFYGERFPLSVFLLQLLLVIVVTGTSGMSLFSAAAVGLASLLALPGSAYLGRTAEPDPRWRDELAAVAIFRGKKDDLSLTPFQWFGAAGIGAAVYSLTGNFEVAGGIGMFAWLVGQSISSRLSFWKNSQASPGVLFGLFLPLALFAGAQIGWSRAEQSRSSEFLRITREFAVVPGTLDYSRDFYEDSGKNKKHIYIGRCSFETLQGRKIREEKRFERFPGPHAVKYHYDPLEPGRFYVEGDSYEGLAVLPDVLKYRQWTAFFFILALISLCIPGRKP